MKTKNFAQLVLKLSFLFLLSSNIKAEEIKHSALKKFADSKQWQRLLFYEKKAGGLHDIHDLDLGFDPGAHISFFDLHIAKENNSDLVYLEELNLVDILSLQDFNLYNLKISWTAKANYFKSSKVSVVQVQAGMGLAKIYENTKMYGLLGLDIERRTALELSSAHISPNLLIGARLSLTDKSWLNFEAFRGHLNPRSYRYQLKLIIYASG